MVDMYSRLVRAGLRKIQKVPDQYKDAVMANLAAFGLDESGNPIPESITSNETLIDASNFSE
jgi:hypothetical protein